MRKQKSRNLKYKKIKYVIIVILIFILTVFSFTLKNNRKLNKAESLLRDSVLEVERILSYPFKYIYSIVTDYYELKNIKQKYDSLKIYVDRIESLSAENIELRKEMENMKDELNITSILSEYEYLNSTVISRNIGYWYNTITLDKGTFNGVENDMVVVNSYGLIGKVISVSTFTCDVRLLTTNDSNNKISVLINSGGKNLYGVINGYNYTDNTFTIEGISNTEHVENDSYIYTSGLGGVFPRGILIGKVNSESTDEYDLAKIIKMVPIADFDDINYVAILKRKSG